MTRIQPCRSAWKGTMTGRERFNNQMHYRPVDRTFNMEFGYWEENYVIWDGFVKNGITNEDSANLFFNFDRRDMAWSEWLLPEFELKVLSQNDKSQIIRDTNGLICEVFTDRQSSIPHFLGSSIKTPADWKAVKQEHLNPEHPGRKPDIDALKKRFPSDYKRIEPQFLMQESTFQLWEGRVSGIRLGYSGDRLSSHRCQVPHRRLPAAPRCPGKGGC